MAQQLSVLGAGTMGAGIAQVAAQAGWSVVLADRDETIARTGRDRIEAALGRLLEKGRLRAAEAEAVRARISVAAAPADHAGSDVLLEAAPEDMATKVAVLRAVIPALPAHAIIATNTSSLSVGEIGRAIGEPARTVGMHFFNPAPIMRLVEVVAGPETSAEVVERTVQIATAWGKVVARATDTPGFIVNQVARPWYLEAFRVLEDGLLGASEIDRVLRDACGFRMGPLELTDLIGQDVNAATTRSVWERLGRPDLLAPAPLQEALVSAGDLGRKTGRGVYDAGQDPPAETITVTPRPVVLAPEDAAILDRFAVRAARDVAAARDLTLAARVTIARILGALFLQALRTQAAGVATADDIDRAMIHGVNHPRGPFEWMAAVGTTCVHDTLRTLARVVGPRFEAQVAPAGPAAPDPELLRKALRAFRTRLKLKRLDDESRLNSRNPLSGGTRSAVVAIMAPREFPPAVWEALAREGKLRSHGGGFYELLP